MENERDHKVKAEISNLTIEQAGRMHREILRIKDEIAPEGHGHVVNFNVKNVLGGRNRNKALNGGNKWKGE